MVECGGEEGDGISKLKKELKSLCFCGFVREKISKNDENCKK